jgi:hypothetical protein
MKFFKMFLISLVFFMFVYPTEAQEDTDLEAKGKGTVEAPYVLPSTSGPIKIDGKLDDKEWGNALKLDLPYETWPGENLPAPVRTEAYLLYDNTNLYVAFRAFDPEPSKLRAYYYERDKITFDDFVAIFIDTFNDERRAYGFRSNPFGVQWDDIRTRVQAAQAWGISLAWDAIYNTAGKIYDWGYAVEMAIPFNQLRFQRTKEDQVWGFNVRRIYSRSMLYVLDHIKLDRSNFCLMCQYVKLKGFKGVKPGRNIELVPTLTSLRTEERTGLPDGEFQKREGKDVEAGLTAQWGITPNITLSGTVNPDFSQVEADALQLDINEPFALLFEERRPFFYEGSDYFGTNFNAVYTRTMRDPSWGVKLTGKAGINTIGAYVVRDDITNLIFPGSHSSTSTSLPMSNISSVFRYKLDLGKNLTLGALGTDREGDDYYNRMLGADGDFRITKKDRVQFQFLASSTRYPGDVALNFDQEQGDFPGTAFDVSYTHDTRNWDFSTGYQDLDDGFRADLGYMPQVNYRRGYAKTDYTWTGKRGGWYREMALGAQYSYSTDQDGKLIYNGGNINLNYRGSVQSYLTVQAKKWTESYLNVEFDQSELYLYFNFKPNKLDFTIIGNLGDRIDYANIRQGQRLRLLPQIIFKPGRHLRLRITHIFERLTVDNERLYTANITEVAARYHINVRTFFRAILQYVDYNYNSDNYLFPKSPEYKNLFSQFLFSYRINPRTVFFLGYSDNYYGNVAFPLTQNDWTVFAKLSYAWSL